jgi:hypothetical protein
MAELIPSFLFSSQKDKRYFLFHPNVELIQLIRSRTGLMYSVQKKSSHNLM